MKDDSGPAFPMTYRSGLDQQGMTLRDYFAAKAMQGIIGEGGVLRGEADESGAKDSRAEFVAKEAYGVAAAMLAEKDRRGREADDE